MSFMEEAYYAWRQKITAVIKIRDTKMSGKTDLYVYWFFFLVLETVLLTCLTVLVMYLSIFKKLNRILKYLKLYYLHIM